MADHYSVLQLSSATTTRSLAGEGFGVVKAARAHREGGMLVLVGVIETPEELPVVRQYLERGWAAADLDGVGQLA